jgi:hypothetical protein
MNEAENLYQHPLPEHLMCLGKPTKAFVDSFTITNTDGSPNEIRSELNIEKSTLERMQS